MFASEYGYDNAEDEDADMTPGDTVRRTMLWLGGFIMASYVAIPLLFEDPMHIFGSLDQRFRQLYALSFFFAALCALYTLNTIRREKDDDRHIAYLQPIRYLLVGAALWAPSMYWIERFGRNKWYSPVWLMVVPKICVGIGVVRLGIMLRDQYKNDIIGTLTLYWLVFHALIMDGMIWTYAYVEA